MVAPFDRPPLPERVFEALPKANSFFKVLYVITFAKYLRYLQRLWLRSSLLLSLF